MVNKPSRRTRSVIDQVKEGVGVYNETFNPTTTTQGPKSNQPAIPRQPMTAAEKRKNNVRRATALKKQDTVASRRIVRNARRFPNRPASDPWASEAAFNEALRRSRDGRR